MKFPNGIPAASTTNSRDAFVMLWVIAGSTYSVRAPCYTPASTHQEKDEQAYGLGICSWSHKIISMPDYTHKRTFPGSRARAPSALGSMNIALSERKEADFLPQQPVPHVLVQRLRRFRPNYALSTKRRFQGSTSALFRENCNVLFSSRMVGHNIST